MCVSIALVQWVYQAYIDDPGFTASAYNNPNVQQIVQCICPEVGTVVLPLRVWLILVNVYCEIYRFMVTTLFLSNLCFNTCYWYLVYPPPCNVDQIMNNCCLLETRKATN